MPWAGGRFTRSNGTNTGGTIWQQDRDAGTKITAAAHDAHDQDVANGIDASINKDGSNAFTGNADLGSNRLTNVANPTVSSDGANKSYVDSEIANVQAGLFWKEPVVVATTANITLSGEQTIDGVLTSTSRILVKDQTASEENGIYVTASGAWSRATNADTWDELVSAAVGVSEGTVNADTSWNCTADAGGTLETTAVTWQEWGGLTSAGEGLEETNGIVSIADDGVTTAKIDDDAVTSAKAQPATNRQTGSTYTFALADNLKTVMGNSGSAQTFTIPTNASVAFGVDTTRIDVFMQGAGVVTVEGDTGVTLNGASAGSGVLEQYGACSLLKVDTDTWLAVGLEVS